MGTIHETTLRIRIVAWSPVGAPRGVRPVWATPEAQRARALLVWVWGAQRQLEGALAESGYYEEAAAFLSGSEVPGVWEWEVQVANHSGCVGRICWLLFLKRVRCTSTLSHLEVGTETISDVSFLVLSFAFKITTESISKHLRGCYLFFHGSFPFLLKVFSFPSLLCPIQERLHLCLLGDFTDPWAPSLRRRVRVTTGSIASASNASSTASAVDLVFCPHGRAEEVAKALQVASERSCVLAVSSCSEEEAEDMLRRLEKCGCKAILRHLDDSGSSFQQTWARKNCKEKHMGYF